MPTARLNGIDIHYESHGEGPPFILSHGYMGSLDNWREQVAPFSARYRFIVYDTRGHGETTAPTDQNQYSLERDYVADKLALLDHLGVQQAYVGGLSMGGMITQAFALKHPSRVKALLLFDTGPGMGMMREPTQRAAFDQMRNMMAQLARTRGMDAIVNAIRNSPAARAMGVEGSTPPDPIRRFVDGIRRMSVDGYLGGAKAMQDWDGSLDRLQELKAPTLVLVGEQDTLLEPSREMHRRIAGSRFVLLRGAGHGTNMWRPDAFVEQTLAFLVDVEAGRNIAGEIAV
jgi:pimeloyl-ACP methyl ester carboxylesterase